MLLWLDGIRRSFVRTLSLLLVVVILIFFLYDVRAGLIVAVTIPLSLLFAFACLDLQGASANLLSIGAIDFGILVDVAVIMVENIYRRLAEREDSPAGLMQIIREASDEEVGIRLYRRER